MANKIFFISKARAAFQSRRTPFFQILLPHNDLSVLITFYSPPTKKKSEKITFFFHSLVLSSYVLLREKSRPIRRRNLTPEIRTHAHTWNPRQPFALLSLSLLLVFLVIIASFSALTPLRNTAVRNYAPLSANLTSPLRRFNREYLTLINIYIHIRVIYIRIHRTFGVKKTIPNFVIASSIRSIDFFAQIRKTEIFSTSQK